MGKSCSDDTESVTRVAEVVSSSRVKRATSPSHARVSTATSRPMVGRRRCQVDGMTSLVLNATPFKSAGAISLKTDAGNGAGGTVAYLTAGTDGSIVFGEGSIPLEFTICSLSRYAGNAKDKIIAKVDVKGDCMTNDIGAECWVHGHVESKVGVAYYNQWKTPTSSFLPGDKITD